MWWLQAEGTLREVRAECMQAQPKLYPAGAVLWLQVTLLFITRCSYYYAMAAGEIRYYLFKIITQLAGSQKSNGWLKPT
jgi:hypothetical protein